MKYAFFCFAVSELLKTWKMFWMKCGTKIPLDANFCHVEEVSECRVFRTLCIKHTGIEFCLVSEFWNIDSNKKVTISFCHILPRKLVCRYRCEQLEFTETFQWYSLFTKVILTQRMDSTLHPYNLTLPPLHT